MSQAREPELNTRAVLLAGAGMVGVVVVALFVAWALIRRLGGQVPAGTDIAHATPAEPALQPHPLADIDAWRRAQQQHLESYGWTDRDAGVVHIPIERAMQLVVSEHDQPGRKQ
ncbi:MAG TPA: hypothetical protein VMH77_01970 [Steroidobacteraceae bacterium]|nr:hypothetical protein [Steroidobacteraceae bacterium]